MGRSAVLGAAIGTCLLLSSAAVAQPAERPFIRGDCNGDGKVAGVVTDAVFLLDYLFLGQAEPPCLKACDVNDDGQVIGQVMDAIAVLTYNFLGGAPPPVPFPDCGTDPTPDGLDCRSSPACPQPPVASFTASPTSGTGPFDVSFDASASSDPDDDLTEYVWDFGDGQASSGVTVVHTYAPVLENTRYTVTLTVEDARGNTDTATRTILVRKPNVPPIAGFHFFPTTGAAPLTVRFYGWESTDPDGSITRYQWDFGDGKEGLGASIGHEFTAVGSYDVSLTVRDSRGAETSEHHTVVVAETEPYPARFVPFVRALRDEMLSCNTPGAAVAVIEGGQVTFAEGFGFRHPKNPVPVTPATLFRIASLTKMMTATGLLRLVDSGQVDLALPITTYLPNFSFSRDASWAPTISVKNLLTHTSAIYDYWEYNSTTSDTTLSSFFNVAYRTNTWAYLMAPAGRMYNYTNVGFMLAGLIAETVSGSYYREYMRSNVFAPLGMTRTVFLPAEALADGDCASGDGQAWSTSIGMPAVIDPDTFDNGWVRPAGLAFSSVVDLAEFVKFLRNGNPAVLSDGLRQAMQEPQMDTEILLNYLHYGYGLFVEDAGYYHPSDASFYMLRLVTHGGDVVGFASDLYYVPALDFGFVALANASGAHLWKSFTTALTTLCEMPQQVPVPDRSNPPSGFPIFMGTYSDPLFAGNMLIGQEGNALTISAASFDSWGWQYKHPMLSYWPRNWYMQFNDGGLTLVTFLLDTEGRSEYLRTRYFVGKRAGGGAGLGASELAAPPPPTLGPPEPLPRFLRPPDRP